MDYKERYENAVKAATLAKQDTESAETIGVLEEIFPELRESEDRKISKAIYTYLKNELTNTKQLTPRTNEFEAWLAWLERQAQKPADKVEPKFNFKVGQWIVATGKCVYLITKIDGFNVTLVDTNGDEYVFDVSSLDDAYQWTIEDAKDGDVLFCKGELKYSNGIKYERICLFNNLDNAFFTLTKTSNFVEEYDIDVNIDYPDNTVPATKEQKEILFMAMKDAGYEFDFEKKELKKIEQKPAWSEGDDRMYNRIVSFIPMHLTPESYTACINWFKSIKDRVQHQSQWKPTRKQLMALRWVLNHIPYGIHKEEISGLFDQIKEL